MQRDDNVDVFVAGYPCQPSSALRKNKRKVSPEDHPGHHVARLVVETILKYSPRCCILENTRGILQRAAFDGIGQSSYEWLCSKVGDAYAVDIAELDLDHWVGISRPRLYIFMVVSWKFAHVCPPQIMVFPLWPHARSTSDFVTFCLCSSLACGAVRDQVRRDLPGAAAAVAALA